MLVRRAARSFALLTVSAVALIAAPAHAAGVPEGWSNPDPVEPLHYLFILAGGPLLLFALIALVAAAPALARGEKLLAAQQAAEAEWIGGPRQGTDELPAPDGADSRAGGASGKF
jgi:hypothetical protein